MTDEERARLADEIARRTVDRFFTTLGIGVLGIGVLFAALVVYNLIGQYTGWWSL